MPYRNPPVSGVGFLRPQGFAAITPDPDPTGWQGATSAATAVGVSIQSQDYSSYVTWLGRQPVARLLFTTGSGGNECTRAQMLSDFTGHMNSSSNFNSSTIIVESTQLVFENNAQTLQQAAETSANDAHWQSCGAVVHAAGRDVRQANGAPKLAMRIGWEMNGSWYPWATSRTAGASGTGPGDTRAQRAVWFAQAFDRAKANMAIGGCRVENVEWVVNFANAWGSHTDNRASIPSGATVISADFYDTSSLYSSNPSNKAGQRAAVWNQKVTSAGGLDFIRTEAIARGLKMGFDEWALSNWANGTGGDDNPDFLQRSHDYCDVAAVTGNLAWLMYFERDTSDGGHANNHRLRSGARNYAFTTAETKFLELFGA